MTGSGSPCGACKFLRRKCVRGCVFAPYFCHEQGAAHFSAIHKVFGASNVSKLLAHLPVNDRCEAAVTISYEAQARLQDPIYGCVAHIFALQQQVVNLQAQLASLKEKAGQNFLNASAVNGNPNEKYYGKPNDLHQQDLQSWFHSENSNMLLQFLPNLCSNSTTMPYYENRTMHPNPMGNYENSLIPAEENVSFSSYDEASHSMCSYDMQTNNRQYWPSQDSDELQSLAFGYFRQT
ncbi:putative LOB domain-containing protein [Quillaja saponaria]|uniref:LOB domain-containing protein n=1 Tax=Quillaja saponaria TaxID=32244 RepID=A0AAD7Q0P3_QUISA|nr:putative LOB domain-containing protein [Quillaja saponaria]